MKSLPIVISASRMTDMPAFYPQEIIKEVEYRKAKGYTIHTIVLWAKHATSIFREPLHNYLKEQQKSGTQIFIQLTVTGLGQKIFLKGTQTEKVFIEPAVPCLHESLMYLEKMIEMVKNPLRIRLRIDPLIKLTSSCNETIDNYAILPEIVNQLSVLGIRHYTFSFLEKGIYRKVDNRFLKEGIEIKPPSAEEQNTIYTSFLKLAKEKEVIITSCSVPGLPTSACIDGKLLQELHDEHLPLDLSQPRSRVLCGCTKSIDIGGWPPKICYSGCLYCYARPKLK